MKKRSLGKMFLLFVVTLTIYRLYWFAKTRKEMMTANKSVKIPSVAWLIIPLLILIAAVVLLIATEVRTENRINDVCGPSPYYSSSSTNYSSNIPPSSYDLCRQNVERNQASSEDVFSILFFFFALIAIWPVTVWWLWKYSKAVEEVTNEKVSFAMSMLVTLLVPDGVDILIIQDAFNKVADNQPDKPAAIPASI